MPISHPAGSSGTRLVVWPALAILLCLALATGSVAPREDAPAGPALAAYPWFYVRDGESLAGVEAAGGCLAELIAVGDVMLGRGVATASENASLPLAGVAPWLRAADLTLGNLESVIAVDGTPRPGPYRLRAPPAAVATLRDAGFDMLGLANNHALDFGPAALAETVSRLRSAGITVVGVGPDVERANQPVIREVNGVSLAFLAFNMVPDPDDTPLDVGWTLGRWDRERSIAAVAAVRARVDAVVVSIHWGYEYELRPDPSQRDAAQALLDAGADLVIGHHPHVVQGTLVSGTGFVAYSLGNFLFDQGQEETQQGLALRACFDQRGLCAVQALPVSAGVRAQWMGLDRATPLLARIRPPAPRVGFACGRQTVESNPSDACHPVEAPQIPGTGLFYSGSIDLTGDGAAESVRRVAEQVLIYQDGVEVWRGLPEWRVLDLALGDPNDDGRGEALLALSKPGAEGVSGSHPFILGYREGTYRVLWGGSAVVDPIREVELGDVDGDGIQELIVLEAQGDGADCAVAVWRWHGWGFSLNWRSPPGRYRDLKLVPGEAGSPPTISVATDGGM